MKKTILLLLTLVGVLAVQGKDNISKSVPVAEFDRISVTSSITVRYTQSPKHKCTITGTRKDVDNIKVEVKGKQLRLTVKSSERKIAGVTFNSAALTDDVVIDISSPQLHKVELIGSGDFIATTPISTTDLTFSIAGSGDITLSGKATNLTTSIVGIGDIDKSRLTVTGRHNRNDVKIATHTSPTNYGKIKARP